MFRMSCGRAKRHDRVLCQRLSNIFRERCLTSSQIEEFVRAPDDTYLDFTIDIILKYGNLIKILMVSKKDLRKLSLLWIAVLESCNNLAELLVRSGADVNELSRLPLGCYMLDLNIKSTVLHVLFHMDSSASENERLVQLVVDHGADLQARDFNGRTVLHIAVRNGWSVQMVEMLLEKGADLQARDFKGRTTLHFAVEKGQGRIAKLLLKKGADFKTRDFKGRTVLHFAAANGRVQMTKMWLEKGVDVNFADDEGMTPLLKAARSFKVDQLLPILLKHGADATVRNHRGENALHCLSKVHGLRHAADVVRVLIEKGASLDDRVHDTQYQPLHLAIQHENNKLVKVYSEHGATVTARAVDDLFQLYLATIYAIKPTMLKTLLRYGADVNQKANRKGHTALHSACFFFANDKRIRLLLSAGADVLAEDRHGRTPFACIDPRNMTKPGSYLIIKELALIKAFQPWIELKDEKIIERFSGPRDYYRDCIEQIERMKSTRFIETCTFFELVTKCHCQIAKLMRNPEFGINFKNYDLSVFTIYAEDILLSFERADKHHQSRLEQEDVINEAVYNMLPCVIVRSVVHYICDCCESVK